MDTNINRKCGDKFESMLNQSICTVFARKQDVLNQINRMLI